MTTATTPTVSKDMTAEEFQNFALRLAPLAASVANFCDHVEHNEIADRVWVLEPAVALRDAAIELAAANDLVVINLYAERLGQIEARNVLSRPGSFDGRGAALRARTWRELQLAQMDHDRYYHPDVVGMAKIEQVRHIALHLAKIVGAFAEPRDADELLRRRLPDILLFAIKLATVMGARMPDEPLGPISADRTAQATARTTV
jgi:hypothetical protein